MIEKPPVLRDDLGSVVVLTLNRPERRNALSRAMLAKLGDHLARLEGERQVRAVVLTGAGTVFCSGMDLKEAHALRSHADAEKAAVVDALALADVIRHLHALDKPTVAALNGDALAGGAGVASACDFVVASEGARLGYPEVKRGLVAAVVLRDLVAQVGQRRARQLVLGGEPIAAGEAERWGLVNRVVPPDRCLDEAVALARSLRAGGPSAQATIKRLLDESAVGPRDLRGPAAVSADARVSAEAAEGMKAFLEKRPPSWSADGTKP